MLVNKITVGMVIQVFDTEKGRFVSQTFIAGDQCDYEDLNTHEAVSSDLLVRDGKEVYLPFDMAQPQQFCVECDVPLVIDTEGDLICPECNENYGPPA